MTSSILSAAAMPQVNDSHMTTTMTLGNAEIVTKDAVFRGWVHVENGKIAEIGEGAVLPAGAIDCLGDYVTPGLIELHTDNLERHIEPRPKVSWPHAAAIVAHDAELASTGITTVFDAMRIGSIPNPDGAEYKKYARALASELLELREKDMLKISHFLHLRAEVCSETLIDEIAEFGVDDRVGIVSLMDHTPGQRQFRDLDKLKDYIKGKRGLNDEQFQRHIQGLYDLREKFGAAHEQATVDAAKRFGAVLASHDDTLREHVDVSAGYGIKLAEFPTTVEAAQACHDHAIAVMMGAPNLIRGGSHSGNVAAEELARMGLLDIISSDYVPAALLQSAVKLGDIWGNMARGIATVTCAPAQAVGLNDRGAVEVGKRADLLRFRVNEGVALLRGVWSRGVQVG